MLQADSEDSDFETVCRVLFARSKKRDDPVLDGSIEVARLI